jgi:hypothetical protein
MDARTRKQERKVAKGRLDWLSGAREEVSRDLREQGAIKEFDRLVHLGCDSTELLGLLICIGPYAVAADGHHVVFDRHDVKTVVKRLQQSANDVERFLSRSRGVPLPGHDSGVEKQFGDLPSAQRLCAAYILALSKRKEFKPRFHFYRDCGIAALVHYVKRKTRHLKDKEVSSLISAVLHRDSYDAQSHSTWRNKHKPLIFQAMKKMPPIHPPCRPARRNPKSKR